MTLTTDSGMKPMCPKCRGYIKNKEQVGVVDDGKNLWHSDCFKDRFGNESATTRRQQARDRLERFMRTDRWARFGEQPVNPIQRKSGARRVA